MSLEKLHKEKMFVLGPLEISPGQFAVGERSYAAIKGNMPYYNELRQRYYMDGNKEVGDAIGELDTRAATAESALKRVTRANKALEERITEITKELNELKKEHDKLVKKINKNKKGSDDE